MNCRASDHFEAIVLWKNMLLSKKCDLLFIYLLLHLLLHFPNLVPGIQKGTILINENIQFSTLSSISVSYTALEWQYKSGAQHQ